MRRQNDINTKTDTADNKSDENDSFDSTKKIKEHAERKKKQIIRQITLNPGM